MTDAIAATLHSYKSLATRKQLQITLEVPAEYAAKALKMLGVADGGESKWFGLTLLKNDPGSSNGRTPDFDSGNGGSIPSPGSKNYTQIAVMKCRDGAFQAWIGVHPQVDPENREAHAVGLLKRKLGIASRSELNEPGQKQDAFKSLLTDFDVRDMVRS